MGAQNDNRIRVLVAEDDSQILRCYERAFSRRDSNPQNATLDALSADLFGADMARICQPEFELVTCNQGRDAIAIVAEAVASQLPFDAVILDVRMPPGINGVDAGERIRQIDQEVPIVFVSGYSDVSNEEIWRRVPPESNLRFYRKPISFSGLAQDIVEIVYQARSGRSN
ncbi:MAG TPA: response regulator [Woeseiaceae bacterium]